MLQAELKDVIRDVLRAPPYASHFGEMLSDNLSLYKLVLVTNSCIRIKKLYDYVWCSVNFTNNTNQSML